MAERFPESRINAVGGFIFLRYLSPIIASPDSAGIVPLITKKEVRRGLILVSKVVQNLANNMLFGNKELFMVELNDIMGDYLPKVNVFLEKMAVSESLAPLQLTAIIVVGLSRDTKHPRRF